MIGFYNVSVILTYLGVVSAVFGMSQAFNGNFKIAILCLMISGLTDIASEWTNGMQGSFICVMS